MKIFEIVSCRTKCGLRGGCGIKSWSLKAVKKVELRTGKKKLDGVRNLMLPELSS